MATLKTIAAALKLIETKKHNLKKAYDDLHQQSHSSLFSSFSLSWSQIDSHFTSIHDSLTHRFHLLESAESTHSTPSHDRVNSPPAPSPLDAQTQLPDSQPDPSTSSSHLPSQDRVDSVLTRTDFSSSKEDPSCTPVSPSGNQVDSVVTRPELRALCEGMDGKGLRNYVNEQVKDREAIRMELPGAVRVAPDPGAMVLDAMEGFYEGKMNSKGDRDPELCGVRRACVLLLEVLMGVGLSFGGEVRERARKLALEWKKKAGLDGENSLEPLGFLHLVAAYKLENEFEKGELVDYFVVVARYRQGTMLCRAIGLGDKLHDLIQKLIDKGKQLLAVKFIFEFGLSDKFPPVPLLKAYLEENTKLAKEVCRVGKDSLKSQNEAAAKEISAFKAVIKVIEEHKLESEYPRENLEKHIEQLEKEKADRKRPAAALAAARALEQVQHQQQQVQQQLKKKKKQQQQQQQSGNKRPRTTAHVGPTAVPMSVAGANSAVTSFQQSHLQPAGLLPGHPAPYLSSAAGPYGSVGSTPAAVPYAGSSAGLYGLAGAPMGFPGNPNPSRSSLYSESHVPSGYYDWPTAYGGYGLPPQYHPSYYPQ